MKGEERKTSAALSKMGLEDVNSKTAVLEDETLIFMVDARYLRSN